MNKNSF